MAARNRQRYILDVDDYLEASFLTPRNANNLISGLNSSATTPLATSAGGTGVNGPSTFQDAALLRYNAAIKKIVSTILTRGDLRNIAAGGDLASFYPDPSIADYAVTYRKMGTDNLIADVLNTQTVLSISILNAGTGYSANANALIAPPNVFYGVPASVDITVASGNITAYSNLIGGSGYTSVPLVTVVDPGPGGTGLALVDLPMTSGTNFDSVFPSVDIANPGSGYRNTATAVVAAISNFGTSYSGTAIVLTPTFTGTTITGFTIPNQGTGYNINSKRPMITIQDGGTGAGAWIVAKSAGGKLVTDSGYFTIKHKGTAAYSANATISFNPPPAGGIQATASLIIDGSGLIQGISITNSGSGYNDSKYFTMVITDPGAGGSGAILSALVTELPSTTGTVLLGAAPSGSGDYSLQWFAQPDFSFLDGNVSPATVYDVMGSDYQYYTIPHNTSVVQVEIYGPGGVGGDGNEDQADGGGGGGGGYVKFNIPVATILASPATMATLDGQGQLKIFVGQSGVPQPEFGSDPTSGSTTTVQFGVVSSSTTYTSIYGATAGGNGTQGGNGSHPGGGDGGTPLYQNATITSLTVTDGTSTIVTANVGGPGNEGGGVNGVYDPADGGNFGDGGVNGNAFRLVDLTQLNSISNIRYQNNSSKSDNNNGGYGLTPGNGGGGGRSKMAGGYGGNGRVIVTAFINATGGTNKYLLVPKVMGLFTWDGTNPDIKFSSNVQAWGFNNTNAPATVNGITGIPAYTLAVELITPFALNTYAVESHYVHSTTDSTFSATTTSGPAMTTVGPTLSPVIAGLNKFYICLSGAMATTGTVSDCISFYAYGPQ